MAEPLTVIYGPTPESRRFALLFGCGFGLVGAVLGGVFLVLGLLLMAASSPEGRPVATGFLCCGTPFGLVFLGVGVWTAFFSSRGEQVVLDAERLSYKERALTLARLTKVAALQGWQRRVKRWTIVIEDDAGGAIELEVTQDRYVGTFDTRGILAALLPRLPASCAIEPRVRAYASGGRLE